MTPNNINRVLLTAALVALGVGLADAAIGGQWDLFAVMAVAAAGLVVVVSRATWGRPAVPLRSDLTAWLRERSQSTGEPMGAIADRAVARYRGDYGARP
jgi:hypothetical protein